MTICSCLRVFENDELLLESLLLQLTEYTYYDTAQRRLYLTGVISYGILRQKDLRKGERRTLMYRLNGVRSDEVDSVSICKNALRNLFGVGLISWKAMVDGVIIPSKRVLPHLLENIHRKNVLPM